MALCLQAPGQGRVTPSAGNIDEYRKIQNQRFEDGDSQNIPVVPDKAVAEVSKYETYRRGWLL